MNKNLKAHISLLLANLIYGANYSIAKFVMPQFVMPSAFIVLRVLSAIVLFWITSLFIPKQKIDKQDYKLFVLCALFGIAINQLLFFKGLSITSPIHASIMMLCSPIIIIVISTFLRSDNFTRQQFLGMFLSFVAAVFLVTSNQIASDKTASTFGDFCIFLNAISWGYYLVIVQRLMKKYHTITVMKWIFTIGLIFVFPFGYSDLKLVEWNLFTPKLWLAVLYVAVFVTYLAYIFNNYALKQLSPGIVGNYIYLQPILATLPALYFGTDSLNPFKIISAITIVVGVYLVSNKRNAVVLK